MFHMDNYYFFYETVVFIVELNTDEIEISHCSNKKKKLHTLWEILCQNTFPSTQFCINILTFNLESRERFSSITSWTRDPSRTMT